MEPRVMAKTDASAEKDEPSRRVRSKRAAKPSAQGRAQEKPEAAGSEEELDSRSDSGNAKPSADAPLVLVVDDYQDAREMVAEYLAYTGFRVAEARNGAEAIEKAQSVSPDLILMDLSLPVMDGWEATRRLKADARTKKIPIIALTGHALGGHSEG